MKRKTRTFVKNNESLLKSRPICSLVIDKREIARNEDENDPEASLFGL